jgi:hypothetical protein
VTAHSQFWEKAPKGLLTTGIGSLPHTFVDAAMNFSFSLSVPFLPQVPIRNPREYMVGQALEGLPGLVDGDAGYSTLDLSAWEKGTKALGEKLETAFRDSDSKAAFEAFEPSPEAWSCWNPFLYELEERGLSFAKIQISGPMTAQWALRFTDGGFADRNPEVGMQVFRLVLARAIAMCRRLRSFDVQPLIFLDEPGFYGFSAKNPRHAMALQELRLFLQTLRREGALVGIHCCSNTDWGSILGLPLDVLSIDTNLSLNLLLTQQEALRKFMSAGGRLALGIVPTGGHAVKIRAHRPELLLERLLETLEAHLSDDTALLTQILGTALYSPACGLALHSIEDAEAILGELLEFAGLCEAFLLKD